MKTFPSMMCLFATMIVAADEAKAQWLYPAPRCPQPAAVVVVPVQPLFCPTVIPPTCPQVVTPICPQIVLPLCEPCETWKQVSYKEVSYDLNGVHHFVDGRGDHWSDSSDAYLQSQNFFVEPFDLNGKRIMKTTTDPLPSPEVSSNMVGVKTHYHCKDGNTYFGTWVSNGSEVKRVWVQVYKPAPKEPQPTPIEKEPQYTPIPQRKTGPALPAPAVDDIPPPTTEPSDAEKPRFDAPVAVRVLR